MNTKKERDCFIKSLKIKENGTITGLICTTHPDRVGDILSTNVLNQIAGYINSESISGDVGSYRSVSLYHDWIKDQDPTLDDAAFIIPGSAKVIPLDDGHYGTEVTVELNKYYKGKISPEEIKYRIENGSIAGFSIEYDDDKASTKSISLNGEKFRVINKLSEYGGVGFARARMIANPKAIIYKEIMEKVKEGEVMGNEDEQLKVLQAKEKELKELEVKLSTKETEISEKEKSLKIKEAEEKTKKPALEMKEILESKEFKEMVEKELQVKSKVLKDGREKEMDTDKIMLSVKEMNTELAKDKIDVLKYKEAASKYFAENPDIDSALRGAGIPLNSSLQVKCDGNKLRVLGQLQVKTTLDTSTNTTTYTQSPVEFADVYVPGIIDTFNNQANLLSAMRKVDHIEGGNKYGWRIMTSQETTLSVDPDEVTVDKKAVKKLKLQTDIKEYRLGVSVSDYTLHHSRASMGDLFMIECEKAARDIQKDINKDLYTEQVDTAGNKVLGLEAVADSAGNASMYGLTRSTANRLLPAAAADTYLATGAALSTIIIRRGVTKVEKAGASRGNLRLIMNPSIRDALLELKDSYQEYGGRPVFGFDVNGTFSMDGIPVIVDSDCNSDAFYVVDWESYYIVMSRPPQLIGLARVGAAEEAFVSVYLAAVYEQPRRIYMGDTLTNT